MMEEIMQSAKSCLEQGSWVMTLAMWPLFVDENMAKELSQPGKVQAFEDYLHEKQNNKQQMQEMAEYCRI